jgi:two-component system, NtrC family, sensor histidine kinase HydH
MVTGMDDRAGSPSPTRQFAVLSLLTIGGSTLVVGLALAHFVEQAILEREWTSTAAFVRAASHDHLRPQDFSAGPRVTSPDSQDRLEEFTRQVRRLPEVLQLVVYGPSGELLWSDVERTSQPRATAAKVSAALAGRTDAVFEPETEAGRERVALYVPVSFPGEGRVAGAVEAYVDASRVVAGIRRARTILWGLAVASAALLYLALYGIVWRASRVLRDQHDALARRAEELARANTELRVLQDQLVATERLAAFGEVTAAVAHGLGNPLAAIRASAQVALLDADGSVRTQLLQIVADTDRLRERMRALLDLARPVESRLVPTALDIAIRTVLGAVGGRSAAQGVRVDVDVPPDLPKVRLDPARFEEALLCLVGNALDAMPAGGALRVAAGPVGTDVELRVEDTGPGMSPSALARAFEPFFTTKPGGTGLGLALARKLLEVMGGRLQLESGDAGTRATIVLPRADA